MSTAPSDTVIPSLPTITGNGLFSVDIVVPDGSFNTVPANSSNSYSNVIMNPAKLIGTTSAPYMNVALPAYISTLYNNVYNINSSLQNSISTAASDNRNYPTSFAVQQYVQSQISGTQIIDGTTTTPDSDTYYVLTTVNNTLITNANPGTGFRYTHNANNNTPISLFWMNEEEDTPRIGASKTVMFGENNYFKDASGVTGDLAFLYAGDNSYFINLGLRFKYYEFVYTGDFISFVQGYNSTSDSWNWLVTASMGVFHNNIIIGNGSSISSNGTVNIPANNTFGGL